MWKPLQSKQKVVVTEREIGVSLACSNPNHRPWYKWNQIKSYKGIQWESHLGQLPDELSSIKPNFSQWRRKLPTVQPTLHIILDIQPNFIRLLCILSALSSIKGHNRALRKPCVKTSNQNSNQIYVLLVTNNFLLSNATNNWFPATLKQGSKQLWQWS